MNEDIIGLGMAYLGTILITIDACVGWPVSNYFIEVVLGAGI